ncbi:MAG: hypothetical protein ACQEQO_02030, partial [Thermodesulfobacteriota bacterium]
FFKGLNIPALAVDSATLRAGSGGGDLYRLNFKKGRWVWGIPLSGFLPFSALPVRSSFFFTGTSSAP